MKQLTYTPPLCRVYRVAFDRVLCASEPIQDNKNRVVILGDDDYDDQPLF